MSRISGYCMINKTFLSNVISVSQFHLFRLVCGTANADGAAIAWFILTQI